MPECPVVHGPRRSSAAFLLMLVLDMSIHSGVRASPKLIELWWLASMLMIRGSTHCGVEAKSGHMSGSRHAWNQRTLLQKHPKKN
eukprot:7215534-Karenia_brevis.AAC.1